MVGNTSIAAPVLWFYYSSTGQDARARSHQSARLQAGTVWRLPHISCDTSYLIVCASSQSHRIVYNFVIQHEFPDIEQLYSRDALLKLIEKQSGRSHWRTSAATRRSSRVWRLATSLARDRMDMDDFDAEKEAARAMEDPTKKDHASSLASLLINGYLGLPLKDAGDFVARRKSRFALRPPSSSMQLPWW
jgi:hypothetical protein